MAANGIEASFDLLFGVLDSQVCWCLCYLMCDLLILVCQMLVS